MEEAGRGRKHSALFILAAACGTLVLLILLFTRLVRNNPLEGEWESTEQQLHVRFEEEVVQISGTGEGEDIYLEFAYTIDKESKIISLRLLEGTQEDLLFVTNRIFSAYNMEGDLKTMDTQFEFSVEGKKLTLMERDYGDKLVLTRK